MLIIDKPIKLAEIQKNHNHFYQNLVKIVVDLENHLIALDAEMHADLEQELLSRGSQQMYLWGANLYFNKTKDTFIEYTSLINIRPSQNNFSMTVQGRDQCEQIKNLILHLIDYDV